MIASEINDVVDTAKRDLAWLLGIHIALRLRENEVLKWGKDLLTHPERNLCVQNLPPVEAAEARSRGIAALRELGAFTGDKPTDGVGAYLNKSAVVYADAILQAMLVGLYKAAGFGSLEKRTVESQIKAIKDGGVKHGLPKVGSPAFDALPYVKWAQFVAQLRHVIVHKMGIVDECFRAHMGFKGAKPTSKCKSALNLCLWQDAEGKSIWADEAACSGDYPCNGQVCIDIERVIRPCVVCCTRFAEAARGYFI